MTGAGRFARTTDADLMSRVQDDDVEAFAELYDRLAPRALAVARGVLGGQGGRASEAVQEGFLSAWRSRAAYKTDRGEVHVWVLGVVRNRAIDSLRHHRRHDSRRADGNGIDETTAAPDDVQANAVAGDAGRRLHDLVADLPDAQREVIVLAYFGQLSHTEIAGHLALPVGTVKGRLRLGLSRLRGNLAA